MQVPLLYVFTVKRNETQKSWITGSRPHWCETQNQFSNLISLTPELSLFLNTVLPSAESTAAAKSPQSCPTLCDPIDGSPPGSPIPGILQARTLEWVAISFSNVWKWKWSRSVLSDSSWPHGLQPTRFLCPWDFPGKSTGVGCHCLLHLLSLANDNLLYACCMYQGGKKRFRWEYGN